MLVTDPIRILISGDYTLLREALRDSLKVESSFRLTGEAGSGDEVIALAARNQPDLVLIDVTVPRSKPARTIRRVLQVSPRSNIIILSSHDDLPLVQEMLAAGASGYLHKSVSVRELIGAINSVCREGRRVIVARSDAGVGTPEGTLPTCLSPREVEVLQLVAQAMSNRQIAVRLSITEGTVKRHLRNIFEKLGAVSRIDAVNKAAAATWGRHPARADGVAARRMV